MRAAVAVCTLAALLTGAGSEVVSGESEANNVGFQYLGKFVYEHVKGKEKNGTYAPTQQMRIEIQLTRHQGKGSPSIRPENWVVLLYDDETSWCGGSHEGQADSCPQGCKHDGDTCSGTADVTKGFEAVMESVKACDDKGTHCHLPYTENGKIQSDKGPSLECEDRIKANAEMFKVKWNADGGYMYGPESRFIQNKLRDRAFYAVLATEDCKPLQEGVSWRIHFANGGGKTWSEFGANEQGLVIMYIVFMFAYLLLCAAQIYSRTIYKFTHHLPRLFTASLTSQTLATVFFTVHYLSFMLDGDGDSSGHPLFKFCGEVATVFSKIVLVLMLVLIAQGWTILRGEVQYRRVIVGLVLTMMGSSFFLLLWGALPASATTVTDNGAGSWFLRDPTSFTYLYTTTPGFFLLGIDLGAAAIFITCCFWTVQRAEELRRLGQRSFLMQIGIAFGAYLLLMPIAVDISAETLDPWAREKWIRTIQMCLTLAAHCGMLFLIWPSRAETHFLVAGNFKAAASGGFASPFASGGDADPGGGGGLGESLLDESEDAFYGGF